MLFRTTIAALTACMLAGSSIAAPAAVEKKPSSLPAYPAARRGNVTDNFFGTIVADPYRHFEDVYSAETRTFVKQQNDLTVKQLNAIPNRDRFQQDLEKIMRFTRYGTPFRNGDLYYWFQNTDAKEPQSILYRARSLKDTTPEVFVNPNLLSPEGIDKMEYQTFSPDQKMFAYTMTKNETDYAYIKLHDVKTKKTIDQPILWAARDTIQWLQDAKTKAVHGIAYYKYAIPAGLTWETAGSNIDLWPDTAKLYYHKLGTDPSKDVFCTIATCGQDQDGNTAANFAAGRGRKQTKTILVTDSKTGGVISVALPPKRAAGTIPGAAWDIAAAAELDDAAIPNTPVGSHHTTYVATADGKDYYRTGAGASTFKLVAVPEDAPSGTAAKDVVPADASLILDQAKPLGNKMFAIFYLEDVQHVIRIVRAFDDKVPTNVTQTVFKFPRSNGVATDIRSDTERGTVTWNYGSYVEPGTVYIYTAATNKLDVFRTHKVPSAVKEVATEQHFFMSRDGARVPTFLLKPKSAGRTGDNRMWLYGYGGFRSIMYPSFNAFAVALARHYGGIWALVNIRGGTEYGTAWYDNGRNLKKQNCFNDIADAAQFFISEKWSAPGLMSIHGGSNGGLLAGAVSIQNPTLFGAGIADYGVHDALRFSLFTHGPGWVDDYGHRNVKEEILSAYKWSPVHNVKPGVRYPAMLVTTGERDVRVAPPHSYKFTAELQRAAQAVKGGAVAKPAFMRVRANSGHNIFSLRRYADTYADKVSFWAQNLGARYRR
ncbi:hypothetical protein HDU86_005613 [Geranomyces michiganensis]|nr:hypothetical protein HDU86_005613 [Geranomyces michiganensis]